MKNKDVFVPIPNKMFAFDTPYFATDEEFILFYHLHCLNLAKDTSRAIVSIDLLNSLTRFDKNQGRGKKKVKKSLITLQEKGYIDIEFDDYQLKNNTTIDVMLPDLNSDIYIKPVKSGNWLFYGFTKVYNDMYERTSSITQLKVLVYVDWRFFKGSESEGTYSITYSEWESVLSVSHQTAVKIIDDCVNEGIIRKHRGQYYTNCHGNVRQTPNRYEVKEEEQPQPVNVEKEINTFLNSATARDNSSETRKHKWFNTVEEENIWLDEDDFYVLLTTNCQILKEHADNRINAISNNPSGQKKMEKLKEKALKRKVREEKNKKIEEERVMKMMEEIQETEERNRRVSRYKSQKASYDISELIEDDQKNVSEDDWLSQLE
ncbi:hypothetical protein [Bacillus marinisedimentorum]|uniref:hypothetical protein n=1 Tax=Bacillus marinisedimentorum TaxID=1821260 RepID=UPI0008725B54|nr:hypothetical protein [Bacillus marinisedimentorum]